MGIFEHFPYTNFHDLNLDWVLRTVKELYNQVSSQSEWIEHHEQQYLELKELYDQIISGNFPPSITQAFETWMSQNALDLVGNLVHMVLFEITDDGHFIAYIPDSWDEITFNTTGYDLILPDYDYGHLTLTY